MPSCIAAGHLCGLQVVLRLVVHQRRVVLVAIAELAGRTKYTILPHIEVQII
jgi:hypothetical protein